MISKAAAAVLGGVAVAVLAAGCSSSAPVKVVTVTVPGSPPASASTPPSAPASSSPVSGATTSANPGQTQLNGTCDTLLPDFDVAQAIGGKAPAGKDQFVVGQPESDIGRLAYINCRYGVTSANATPAIEIGVSLYDSPADAAARIPATVDDYTAHGATTSEVTVDGKRATMLTGGNGDGYDVPTLVLAAGQRTVAVSVAASVATGQQAQQDAIALAKLALKRTTP